MSNQALRILTALVGIPVVLGVTYVGGWPFGLLVIGVSLVAQHELYGLMDAADLRPRKLVGIFIGVLVGLRALVPEPVEMLPLALAAVLLLIAFSPFIREEEASPASLAATVFGALYPTFLLTYLVDLRLGRGAGIGDLEAFYLTLTTLLLIWSTDTFAYYVGRSIGKHPLAPRVSPKKTWEGAVGGALGAFVVAAILKVTLLETIAWEHMLMIALICGVFSQLGDLAESKMKRAVGVKDSGTILPGHGGLLDRFDAMILAAPFVYLYLRYVAGILA